MPKKSNKSMFGPQGSSSSYYQSSDGMNPYMKLNNLLTIYNKNVGDKLITTVDEANMYIASMKVLTASIDKIKNTG